MRQDLRSSLLVLTLAAIAVLFLYDIRNFDVFLHLHAGRHIVSTGTIPDTDPFSAIASGREWVNHSWLSAVMLYLVRDCAGVAGLVLFRVAAMVGVAVLLVLACRRAGGEMELCCAVVLLACAAARPSVVIRPVLLTFLLASAFLLIPRAVPRSKLGVPIALVTLTALWSNLHGGVLIGLVIVGSYALSHTLTEPREAPRYWATLAACALATLLNPFGYRVIAYPLKLAGMGKVVGNVTEWLPPEWSRWHVPFGLMAALVIASVVVAVVTHRDSWRRPWFLSSLLLSGFFGAMSCRVQRNMPLFALFAAVASIEGLAPMLSRKRIGTAAWCVSAIVAFTIVCADRRHLGYGISQGLVPEHAFDVILKSKLHGNVLSEYRWGGYTMWRGGSVDPPLRPVIDGRNEVYGEKLYAEVAEVVELKPGWEQKLADWRVRFMVLDRKWGDETARESRDWKLVHFDDVCVVWAKRTPANQEIVDQLDCAPLHPDTANALIFEGRQLDLIERKLVDKLAEDTSSVVATRLIAKCALKRQDYQRSRDLFATCARLAPRDADIRYHLGYTERKLRRPQVALAHYLGAIRLCPDRALYHLGAAQCLVGLRGLDEAEKHYRRAVELAPKLVVARSQLAELLCRVGRVAEAKEQIRGIASVAGDAAAQQVLQRLRQLSAPAPGGRR